MHSLDEQTDGVIPNVSIRRRRVLRTWQREGRDDDHDLSRDAKELSTRRQDTEIGAGADERFDKGNASRQHVITPIEHETDSTGLETFSQRDQDGRTAFLAHPQRGRHDGWDERWISNPG
jgi:hypothetical protein